MIIFLPNGCAFLLTSPDLFSSAPSVMCVRPVFQRQDCALVLRPCGQAAEFLHTVSGAAALRGSLGRPSGGRGGGGNPSSQGQEGWGSVPPASVTSGGTSEPRLRGARPCVSRRATVPLHMLSWLPGNAFPAACLQFATLLNS